MKQIKTIPDPCRMERDACGIGAVVNIDGRPTRKAVDDALSIVERLDHRAGRDASGKTGDGVGIMTQIPHRFFSESAGLELGQARDYGVGMFFLSGGRLAQVRARKLFETVLAGCGLRLIGWRAVPVCPEVLGERARGCMPGIWQAFVARPEDAERGREFDCRLYTARREFEQTCENACVVSLSSRTVVYKGMFLVNQLRQFYPDLRDERFESAIAMVHSRFSTNTSPSWERAHPNRFILHNGEINTIRGNAARMLAREETMRSELLEKEGERILPVIDVSGSDSAMLDNSLEFLCMNGMELPLAVMTTMPQAWKNDPAMDPALRDFYRYYATMMEPWDGPAAVMFSDGDIFGAALDRNGLRPCRYCTTSDGRLIMASEVGVLDIPDGMITGKYRMKPGGILVADTAKGRLLDDGECKRLAAARRPYGEWLKENLVSLEGLPETEKTPEGISGAELSRLCRAFGYSREEIASAILPMAEKGVEPTASMGADIPLAVLSEKHQPLFGYFRQLFAQVTNPPIDSMREKIVTDTTVYVGSDGNILRETPENCRVLEIENPILTDAELMKIKALDRPGLRSAVLPILYYKGSSLEKALEKLFFECDRAFRSGRNIIILSDRGVDAAHIAIPSLLAVSALEQHLIRTRRRTAVSIILESGEPRDVHQFALLMGYGARAVNPYLAHGCVAALAENKRLSKGCAEAIKTYDSAILDGIVRIAAKMGISTLQSYQSAQIFEAVGISREVTERYFTGTVSRVGGIGLAEISEGALWRHDRAFDPLELETDGTPDSPGFWKLRSGADKEDHMYNPMTIIALQQATQNGDYERFKEYAAMVDSDEIPHTLRGLLEFDASGASPVPLDEVEPESEIVKRFKTGAMSYGSISGEAHECMAVAMNRLHGRSNSGEGGEEADRLGTERGSAIKQVASGRFGVTSAYLVSASEIQIKMAQGAKPGEGGHLPGRKVYPWIARTRCSTPGVALISPPPHHDIYSIEDLAQLIFDLKNANRRARISVKLVSEAGVGTIAAGVAKAGAQVILISGSDGGTGAAPRSSIYNAGLPWELGLSETHRALMENGLRSRVRLETDGKLMTGRDVAIACMLGAEEFGFATAPLVTMGCMMMRVCNLDTCPFGIATQNRELRERFRGKPEYVMNFMLFVARQLREIMARMGFRSVDEMVGRADRLRVREKQITRRAESVDLSQIIDKRYAGAEKCRFDPADAYDFRLERTADEAVLLKSLAEGGLPRREKLRVSCTDRAVGTMLGSALTEKYGASLPEDSFTVECSGGAGQSFGAFIPRGLTLVLTGEANDGLGKGLSGGRIVLRQPPDCRLAENGRVIAGNVALYGATSGEAYIAGDAGERFCVRNSGATAVAEGCGEHGCEYMTGGTAVILGETGENFAAGMSGGVAYVLDRGHTLSSRLNGDMVGVSAVSDPADAAELRGILEKHFALTGSEKARAVLENFEAVLPEFRKIVPNDYKRKKDEARRLMETGMPREEAEYQAFCGVER